MILSQELDQFRRQGCLLVRSIFRREEIETVLSEAKNVFLRQTDARGWRRSEQPGSSELLDLMARLFEQDFETFSNCGKHAQHLISLHRLALDPRITDRLHALGIASPSICTRPVLYFNHIRLAKKDVYWKVFPHQDWRSMQGSLNSIVVWLPLVPIDRELGALEIIRSSHLAGLVSDSVEDGFGRVNISGDSDEFESVECEPGDALFFSSFLIHQSGTNTKDEMRWSCHFRYNDLGESSFVDRGYPHPYVYRPLEPLLTPGFPSVDVVRQVFDNGEFESPDVQL